MIVECGFEKALNKRKGEIKIKCGRLKSTILQ
jgi:hypothetical protein